MPYPTQKRHGHNWILLTAGMTVAFAAGAARRPRTATSAQTKGQIVLSSRCLDLVIRGCHFSAPMEPGEYPFLCFFQATARWNEGGGSW